MFCVSPNYDELGRMIGPPSMLERVHGSLESLQKPEKPCKYDKEGKLLKLGKVIKQLIPGGQAEKLGNAGIQPDDVVESYNGAFVRDGEQLVEMVSQPGGGDRELTVLRGGKRLTFHFAPGPIGIELAGEVPTDESCTIRPWEPQKPLTTGE
jgi:hypothetical protein